MVGKCEKDSNSSGGDKAEIVELFLKIGLEEKTAKKTVANNKATTNLIAIIQEAEVSDGCDRVVGNLLYTIKTRAQLEAAFAFLAAIAAEDLKADEFEEACGVGVEVSAEDIKIAVDEAFEEKKSMILEQHY